MSKFEDEYKTIKQNQGLKIICEYLMSRNDMVSKLDNPKNLSTECGTTLFLKLKRRQ